MDPIDVESLAEDAHARAGIDPSEPTNVFRLARRLPELRSLAGPLLVKVPGTLGGRVAALSWVRGEPRIAVSTKFPVEVVQHAFAHELAHLLMGKFDHRDPEVEQSCDLLAAALIAARPAVLELHRRHGTNLRLIARDAVSTQTWAALRLGECLGLPVAAVSPGVVRVRGPQAWVWPTVAEIRAWNHRPRPGIRKVTVTDRPKRSVFLAEYA